jgi:3-methylfumaryl-CoA hydratase
MSLASPITVSPEQISTWRDAIGRTSVLRQTLDEASLQRFAVATGAGPEIEACPPPLAHWAYFLEAEATARLGPDGHPQRGLGLLPPITLPRRMFAAGAMQFHATLSLREAAELSLTVADVTLRQGKTGDLVFVELDRVLSQQGQARVSERQTLVYRGQGDPVPPVSDGQIAGSPTDQVWTPTTVELFRFSAATFNAHRIHYDQGYAREVEGYPDLVVHGPLTAARLASLAVRQAGGAPLRTFHFRAVAPLFVNQPVRLSAGDAPGRVLATRCDGTLAMSAEALL